MNGAFTNIGDAQIFIDTPLPITKDLLNIPFLSNSGTIVSEAGYPYPLHATFIHGSDFLRRDRDGQHVRLDVTSTARDDTGALLRFSYNGIVGMAGEEGKVIRGDKNATTTGFGSVCKRNPPNSASPLCGRERDIQGGDLEADPRVLVIQVRFETESAGLKPLEDKLYVGSGRFIVEENKPTIVEYKISEVGAPPCSE